MATDSQRQRLRLDLGLAADDTTSLPDATIDDIFTEAGESYTEAASLTAYTRVITLDRLLMQAANEVDYTENNSTERASQRHTHLTREREKWQGKLDAAVKAAGGGAARFGRTARRPRPIREFPGW